MTNRRPRRIIRGYRALKQYTGYGETRTRAIIADGTHPRPMKGARAVSFFEDEIAEWQRQRATKVTHPHAYAPYAFMPLPTSPHSSVLSMCPTKKCVRDNRP